MPSHLDFDSTKNFRNYILGRTLTVPNGPQSFSAESYGIAGTSDMSNKDPGDVETVRPHELVQSQTHNLYKPLEYFVNESMATIPRRANLSLYPAFVTDQNHSFISIMTRDDYDNESQLMKFAAWNIKSNEQGPFFARMQANLYKTTLGKVRVLDALQGNSATAINIITGREPLIETNTKITVAKTALGKGVDFLQTVTGVEFPWSEIPGNYLTNPNNPIRNTETLLGRIFRRPNRDIRPSDLFLDYSGAGQKSALYNNISYSRYGPDYTRSARSQNTSKVLNFVDKFAMGVNKLLGTDAPKMYAYIGDDRGANVQDSMSDAHGRQVRSSYYLSMLFDPVQATVFLRTVNISEGGGIGGNLTWISTNSKNKLGANNPEFISESSQYDQSLSTNYEFREDSILGLTQEILETLPTEGGESRSHVANVIDQTSRIFREDDKTMSRGSAIKYVDKYTGVESGVEYCRVWTKDRSHMNYSDTMKKTGLSRKFDSSVFSNAWNLNIYPNSNGNGGFDSSSTNMAKGLGDGFYAKKYMFSIENLAWKTSNTPGFTYNDLPYCERGGNGGRVMWFPPYGLRVTEQNSASWNDTIFLGRPEPVYTYQNTSRQGTIQFKVIVDHPSILNLMVKDLFKNMSDEEADNYINAFFAGCEDIDFYGMIRKYTTLSQTDVQRIQSYLNQNNDPETIKQYKTVIRPAQTVPTETNAPKTINVKTALYFQNDYPSPSSEDIYTDKDYSSYYDNYLAYQPTYMTRLNSGLDSIPDRNAGWVSGQQTDYKALTFEEKETRPTNDEFDSMKTKAVDDINKGFTQLQSAYEEFETNLENIKLGLSGRTIGEIKIKVGSRTSSVADDNYNLYLSYRRSYSIIKYVVNQIAKTQGDADKVMESFKWTKIPTSEETENVQVIPPISLKDFGYSNNEGNFVIEYVANVGEQPVGTPGSGVSTVDCTDNYTIVNTDLKHTAPVTFLCRETSVALTYEEKAEDQPPPDALPPTQTLVDIDDTTLVKPAPPLDEMKKIIMKTLSECFYFKKLEEDSPVQFSSLKEKLRYFHPSFHSMTPEGLNSRLTFLQQCIRPGETLPIKGISDVADTNARNTTFGPPPICVMRIGDFYHSKIAIKDINIEFEEDLWDLNPEGIGVQPMIANVTLQIHFIGGHGLAKPVERLQNALSSNFYANTEMYDARATSTEKTIDGTDVTKFTKEFLETLVEDNTQKRNDTSQDLPNGETDFDAGVFIGDHTGGAEISYDKRIYEAPNGFYDTTSQYYNSFRGFYNQIVKQYGTSLSSIILSPTYRSNTDYIVQTGGGTRTVQLFGAYPKGEDFEVLRRDFKGQILTKILEENISEIFEFNKDLTPAVIRLSEDILNPYIHKRIGEIVDDMSTNGMDEFEEKRTSVIKSLDGLNFIIETDHDGSITGEEYTGANFTGYTDDLLYDKYSGVVDYIEEAEPLFSEDLDTTSYIFSRGTVMSTEDLSKFLSELLNSDKEKAAILEIYENDPIFTDRIKKDIKKRIKRFMTDVPEDKDFSKVVPKNMPSSVNDNPTIFNVEDFDYVFTDDEKTKLKSVHNTSTNNTVNELNYYR